MGSEAKNKAPLQGGGASENTGKTMDHVVTQEDLDNNHELGDNGVKLGDTIQIPVKDDTEGSPVENSGEKPEWVNELLASNQAVIDSNNAVVEAVKVFEDKASDIVNEVIATAKNSAANPNVSQSAPVVKLPEIDSDATYIVAKGKTFEDKENPGRYFSAGDDVTDLDNERLKNLLSQGIIVVAEETEGE